MKTCNMSLPELFRAEESVHTDEMELDKPEINAVEIKELHREIKLEKPTELDKSKLHPKQKKVLTSRAVKRAGLEKGKTCRPHLSHQAGKTVYILGMRPREVE